MFCNNWACLSGAHQIRQDDAGEPECTDPATNARGTASRFCAKAQVVNMLSSLASSQQVFAEGPLSLCASLRSAFRVPKRSAYGLHGHGSSDPWLEWLEL